jgi:hypothetical protein
MGSYILAAITRARADGAQESLDMPDAMDVGDGHPTRPVPGSSPRLHAQGGAEQVYNPLSRHTPLMGATLEGLGSTSTAGQTSLNHARFSGAGLMLTFENSVPSASHSRLEVPVRKTWRAEEGPELGGACGAHLVASTAHDLDATDQAPPPAALRTRAQPVAAAPKVLQRPVPSASRGDRVMVWEDDSDFANQFPTRATREAFLAHYLDSAAAAAAAAAVCSHPDEDAGTDIGSVEGVVESVSSARILAAWARLRDPASAPASEAAQLQQSFVAALDRVVCRFLRASHLFWGSWSVVQSSISTIDFDYLGYASMRFQGWALHCEWEARLLA